MITFDEFVRYKAVEQFLDSLVFAKPIPHFVAPKHAIPQKNPFGLERITSFLHELGNPQRNNKYLHIAGTSGKTSTTHFIANLLQAQGYTTGRFTSPHLHTFAEYFTMNGHLPPLREILKLVEQTKPLIDREYEQKGFGMISYAEYLLALALRYFAENQADYVALEAFLGGKHDATNVIERSEVSILTNIGFDHVHILGDTLEAIAADKAGIMKSGCPFITAEQRPEILELFREKASSRDTAIQVLGQDFQVDNIDSGDEGLSFDYTSDSHVYRAIRTGVYGAYQAANAALAIRALELVSKKNESPIQEDALRQALLTTTIPGRFERVSEEPVVILDVAHNPDKVTQFISQLKRRFQQDEVIFVCAFTSGKKPEEMLRSLLEAGRSFYVTRVIIGYREGEEPLYLKSLLTSLCPLVSATIALDPSSALEMAMEQARKQGKAVCVTGSVYLVAYLRQRWFPEHTMLRWS